MDPDRHAARCPLDAGRLGRIPARPRRVPGPPGQTGDAYHDFAQSSSVFELLGDRYQAARTHLALGRMAAQGGARSLATRYLDQAAATFSALGAARDLADVEAARTLLAGPGTGEFVGASVDGDEAVVRRVVDAAALPELLARETVAAVQEATRGDIAVVFVKPIAGGEPRVISACGAAKRRRPRRRPQRVQAEPPRRRRWCSTGSAPSRTGGACSSWWRPRPAGHLTERRLRMIVAVAGQGFELCARAGASGCRWPRCRRSSARSNRCSRGSSAPARRCKRVVDQIHRLQGNDLTVLITGESGTGKELVARAIHVGSPRCSAMFLPYNCTTTTRELADSQLFGHRRGSFTGAHSRPARALCAPPLAARSSWMKSVTFPSTCSRSYCGSWSRVKSCRSARCVRSASMCA